MLIMLNLIMSTMFSFFVGRSFWHRTLRLPFFAIVFLR